MQFELLTKKKAIEEGLKLYFTGVPCKHGHIDPRYTASGVCRQCHRDFMRNHRRKIMAKRREALNRNKEV